VHGLKNFFRLFHCVSQYYGAAFVFVNHFVPGNKTFYLTLLDILLKTIWVQTKKWRKQNRARNKMVLNLYFYLSLYLYFCDDNNDGEPVLDPNMVEEPY